ncbi:MAG TPA: site-2 protease family protein [Terriglobia bacterium]|nr:site-2 protease family protein [Terriglobia bacterium]
MGDGFTHSSTDSSVLTSTRSSPPNWWRWRPAWRFRAPAWTSSLSFHLFLFAATALTTLTVGAQIALNYSRRLPAFNLELSSGLIRNLRQHPASLLPGLPFSLTLLGILLAHEMGHYVACRRYGLRASYPYFIPAPTLIGTLGAFIKIRSPIYTRRILFEVAVAGPIAGFVLAAPALAWAVLHSHVGSTAELSGTIVCGKPLALTLLTRLLRPGVNPGRLALSPVGCAAWVGLFATALNLLPMSQLDGGHILYAVLGRKHRPLSRSFWLALLPLGYFCWLGWFMWAAIIGFIGIGHPPVVFPEEKLGRAHQMLAVIALVMLILSFMPTPFTVR